MMTTTTTTKAIHITIAIIAATTTTTTNTNNLFVSSFSLQSHQQKQPVSITTTRRGGVIVFSSPEDEPEPQGLFLGNDIEKEMKKAKADAGEYDFGQIDYLALARQRAAAQLESNNDVADDEEWTNLADEKKSQFGQIDDWENSQKEAGNTDSQILMFTEEQIAGEGSGDGEGGDGGEGDGDDGPKLLLF